MSIRSVLGVLAIAVGLSGYVPYFRGMLRGTTKPHALSWLIWGSMQAIAFAAQWVKGAGSGAWVTGVSSVIALTIAATSLRYARAYVRWLDAVALGGAVIGIAAWLITNEPLLAVICVAVADACGYIPTLRKAYDRPHEETAAQFALSAAKWMIALPALVTFNLTTVLYPASLIVTNGAVVVLLMVRRKTLTISRARVQ